MYLCKKSLHFVHYRYLNSEPILQVIRLIQCLQLPLTILQVFMEKVITPDSRYLPTYYRDYAAQVANHGPISRLYHEM